MIANEEIKTVRRNRGVRVGGKERTATAPPRTKATRIGSERGLLSEHAEPKETAVKFQHYNPQAIEVFVAGTFNDWDPRAAALRRDGNGAWALEILLLPGQYEYRFVVDGVWREDSMASKFSANPFGGLNSIIDVK